MNSGCLEASLFKLCCHLKKNGVIFFIQVFIKHYNNSATKRICRYYMMI